MLYHGKHMAQRSEKRRPARFILTMCAAALLMTVLFGCVKTGAPRYEAPIIQGVQDQLTAVEGDDISAIVLEGVTAVGGEDRPEEVFPVTVEIFDAGGQQVTPAACTPGTYEVRYSCTLPDSVAAPVRQSTLTVAAADREPPVISGVRDLEVAAGGSISYREGITVTDNKDTSVRLQINSSAVDLTKPGLYYVIYSAEDSAGNVTQIPAQVTVTEAEEQQPEVVLPPIPDVVTQEMVDALCDNILSRITNDGMSQKEKAYKIYKYVYSHIKYVGTSDKSSWLRGAYVGFVHSRGDCYNYFACSKALLTRAGIPNIDLTRVGGNTRHYWQLIDVGEGWHHFDACWHPTGYERETFHLTEAEVRAYTELVSPVRLNYFVYDYDSCPVIPVGTPEEEAAARLAKWEAEKAAAQQPADPEVPVEGETPVDPETPTEGETPAEPETPTEGETPVDPETPTEGETPAEPETPTEGEAPAEPETPTEGEAPAEPETPAEGEAPADPELPVEDEIPVEAEPPAETEEIPVPEGEV